MIARLKFAITVALMLAGLGILLASTGWYLRGAAQRGHAAAQSQRSEAQQRLARASDEAREIAELLPRYRALAGSALLGRGDAGAASAASTGDERRLLWVDHVVRVREDLGLDGFKFLLEPQKVGDPLFDATPLVAQSSRMSLEFSPLHEAEFLVALARFLAPGGDTAIAQARDCSLARNEGASGAALGVGSVVAAADQGRSRVPLLAARCNIEWLTLVQPVAETDSTNAEPPVPGTAPKK
jgi:hypothetical protein